MPQALTASPPRGWSGYRLRPARLESVRLLGEVGVLPVLLDGPDPDELAAFHHVMVLDGRQARSARPS